MSKNFFDELREMENKEKVETTETTENEEMIDSIPTNEETEFNIEDVGAETKEELQEENFQNEETKAPEEVKALADVQEVLKTQEKEVNENTEIIDIACEKLVPYRDNDSEGQPFESYTKEEKERMIESIKLNGILHPIIVRPYGEDTYQILSGHNRVACAIELGMEKVPCIIKDVDDDTAKLIMIQTNLVKRENISIMTRAKVYKMQADVYKNKNIDIRKNSERINKEDNVRENLKDTNDMSYRNILRYIKLNDLIPEFHDLVNNRKINFRVAVQIAGLSKAVQKRLYNLITEDGLKLSENQVAEIKKAEDDLGKATLTQNYIADMCYKPKETKLTISFSEEEIDKFFANEEIKTALELKEAILKKLSVYVNEVGE